MSQSNELSTYLPYVCTECGMGPFTAWFDLEKHIQVAHGNIGGLVAETNGVTIKQSDLIDDGRVVEAQPVVRTFTTGANRDVDTNKLDFEGFLNPRVLFKFAEYMHKNRRLKDGSLRDSDNWQKGIPIDVYMKSAMRHWMAIWLKHRTGQAADYDDLCAMLFNVQGLILENLKKGESNVSSVE